jgi:putative sterol carrier protein
MTRTPQDIDSHAFWDALLEAANADADFRQRSAHVRDIGFHLCIGTAPPCALRVHQGRIERAASQAPAFTVTGPLADWRMLLSGETVYGQATNIAHGQLRVSGDALAATWLTRPLWQLWRLSAQLLAEGAEHA